MAKVLNFPERMLEIAAVAIADRWQSENCTVIDLLSEHRETIRVTGVSAESLIERANKVLIERAVTEAIMVQSCLGLLSGEGLLSLITKVALDLNVPSDTVLTDALGRLSALHAQGAAHALRELGLLDRRCSDGPA
ncbi:MAG TPA: hypothetical protein V6C89_18680 [Drouetiella sp.]|jgi:hypothetical protein